MTQVAKNDHRLMQVLLAAHIFGVSVKRLFRCRLDAENCPEP